MPNYVPTQKFPCPHCNRGLRTTNTGYICDRCRVTFGKKEQDTHLPPAMGAGLAVSGNDTNGD